MGSANLTPTRWLRRTIVASMLVVVLALIGYFVYELIPKPYTLKISGGDILGSRHLIAKVLKEEAVKHGIQVVIEPTEGSVEAVEQVSEGTLDMALVQSGLEDKLPHVEHVATLPAEVVHFLVKPNITDIEDLKGKSINTGTKSDGIRSTTLQILDFSNLNNGVDYIETNYSLEQLVKMKDDKLPDAIVNVSYSPSFVADYFVKERDYKLLELPFPPSLALRFGWVGNGLKILAYTYNTIPAVPETDIDAVGVNMQLIANENADPDAVAKLLEVLYSPMVMSRINQIMDESKITLGATYPISTGTIQFMKRNESIFSEDTIGLMANLIGLVVTLGSFIIVIMRWVRSSKMNDQELMGYIAEVSHIEREIGEMEREGRYAIQELTQLTYRLTTLKSQVLERNSEIKLKDPALMQLFIDNVTDTRNYVSNLIERAHAASKA